MEPAAALARQPGIGDAELNVSLCRDPWLPPFRSRVNVEFGSRADEAVGHLGEPGTGEAINGVSSAETDGT